MTAFNIGAWLIQVGWFANAMMAMHDHIRGGPVVLPDGSASFVADVPINP